MGISSKGRGTDEVLEAVRGLRAFDVDWRSGRLWNLVYYVDDEVGELARAAAGEFVHENGVSPLAFPSIRRIQTDLIDFTTGLLGGGFEASGVVTGGGTESILLATLAAREHALTHRSGEGTLEVLLPVTAHPAWEKAAHYLGLRPVYTGVDADFRASVPAMREKVGDRTALLVGSAPTYCHGVLDPIAELAALAAEHGACMHVDACLGGYLLPFARRLGFPIPAFDLSVDGVTSISADLHKYGFAPKGVSVLLYRDPALRRRQYFVQTRWPGGIYATSAAGGSRSVSAMAAAWAVTHHLGLDGYLEITRGLLDATRRLIDGIRAIEGLEVLGDPIMTVFSFRSTRHSTAALADGLQRLGWHFDRQQAPDAIHVGVTQGRHASLVDPLLRDIERIIVELPRDAAAEATPAPEPQDDELRRLVMGFLDATLDGERASSPSSPRARSRGYTFDSDEA